MKSSRVIWGHTPSNENWLRAAPWLSTTPQRESSTARDKGMKITLNNIQTRLTDTRFRDSEVVKFPGWYIKFRYSTISLPKNKNGTFMWFNLKTKKNKESLSQVKREGTSAGGRGMWWEEPPGGAWATGNGPLLGVGGGYRCSFLLWPVHYTVHECVWSFLYGVWNSHFFKNVKQIMSFLVYTEHYEGNKTG